MFYVSSLQNYDALPSSTAQLIAMRHVLIVMCIFLAAACTEAPADEDAALPELTTRGDSLAWRMVESMGGLEAWQELPYLRFDFAVGQDDERVPVAHHLWDRRSGDYRVEWRERSDSTYTVLFNVRTREGTAYLNGQPADSVRQMVLLNHAYRRFINDTYWMLAPVKVFDPGVERTYLADSSTAEHEVLRLTFSDVGVTPGDRYLLYIDAQTGRLDRWAFVLQGNPEAPPSYYRWIGYEGFKTAAGSLYVGTRKESIRSLRVIYTDRVVMPESVPAALFSDPSRPLPQAP